MFENLLIHIVQEGGKEVPYFGDVDGSGWLGEALLYALIGFVVTFIGIVILIFIVWLCGKIVRCFTKSKKKQAAAEAVSADNAVAAAEDVSDDVRVAIIAAIAAYYASENAACEFQVKRIKRL